MPDINGRKSQTSKRARTLHRSETAQASRSSWPLCEWWPSERSTRESVVLPLLGVVQKKLASREQEAANGSLQSLRRPFVSLLRHGRRRIPHVASCSTQRSGSPPRNRREDHKALPMAEASQLPARIRGPLLQLQLGNRTDFRSHLPSQARPVIGERTQKPTNGRYSLPHVGFPLTPER
jgi:hypothetical protein